MRDWTNWHSQVILKATVTEESRLSCLTRLYKQCEEQGLGEIEKTISFLRATSNLKLLSDITVQLLKEQLIIIIIQHMPGIFMQPVWCYYVSHINLNNSRSPEAIFLKFKLIHCNIFLKSPLVLLYIKPHLMPYPALMGRLGNTTFCKTCK